MIIKQGSVSVSAKLIHDLRLAIVKGDYPPGSQFPPTRALAVSYGINPNTVQKAMTVLEEEGLLINRGTVGRFVTENAETVAAAHKALKESYMRLALKEARAMGISETEFIDFIKESEGSL